MPDAMMQAEVSGLDAAGEIRQRPARRHAILLPEQAIG